MTPTLTYGLSPESTNLTQNGRSTVRVLVMIGSTRQDRFGPVPAAWVAEHAARRADSDVDVLDLAEAGLPVVMAGDDEYAPLPAEVIELGRRIGAADAVVIVIPVYNRSFPASLKNAIDWVGDEWAATPVGSVSYGGRTGGIEAVEQLRPIFVELDTMTIRKVLSFPNFWTHFNDNDAELLARHIDDDAVIVGPAGTVTRGPLAVEEVARELLIGGPLAGLTAHYRLTEISLLAPDVAVAPKSAWSIPTEADDGARRR